MSYLFAEIHGVRMHYDMQGDGPTLVLIHEGIADLRMFDDQMRAFTPHFRVIRYDVRGFGQTPDPAGEYREHGDLAALLEFLGVRRAHVLGIRNGGRIAIDFAITYPEMLDRFVLVAPALGGFDYPVDPMDEFDEQAEEAKKRGDLDLAAELEAKIWGDGPSRLPVQVDPTFRKRILSLIRETVAISAGEGEGRGAQPPAAGRLSEVKAPTLLIIGEYDVRAMFAVADALESGIPNIKRVQIAGRPTSRTWRSRKSSTGWYSTSSSGASPVARSAPRAQAKASTPAVGRHPSAARLQPPHPGARHRVPAGGVTRCAGRRR